MVIDVDKLLDRTVTVLNRLGAKEAGVKQDSWYPTVLSPASWSETLDRSYDSDGTVHLSRSVRLQVPEGVGEYLPRQEWVRRASEGTAGGCYTLTTGDYAVLGDPGLTRPLSRSEMQTALEGWPCAEIAAFRDLRHGGAVDVSSTGCAKYAGVLYAEGR